MKGCGHLCMGSVGPTLRSLLPLSSTPHNTTNLYSHLPGVIIRVLQMHINCLHVLVHV